MMKQILALTVLSTGFSASLLAADPVNACRVKADLPASAWSKVNNAGCVIAKEENGIKKFFMVYVDKGENDKGWGFPGGKPATRKNDAKLDDNGTPKSIATAAIANQVEFDYIEPAPCTAARETREEMGQEVIVGDIIVEQKYFIAFECFLADSTTEQDTQEI